jgi:hypothetical protein
VLRIKIDASQHEIEFWFVEGEAPHLLVGYVGVEACSRRRSHVILHNEGRYHQIEPRVFVSPVVPDNARFSVVVPGIVCVLRIGDHSHYRIVMFGLTGQPPFSGKPRSVLFSQFPIDIMGVTKMYKIG